MQLQEVLVPGLGKKRGGTPLASPSVRGLRLYPSTLPASPGYCIPKSQSLPIYLPCRPSHQIQVCLFASNLLSLPLPQLRMSHYSTPSDPSASSSPPTIPPRTFHISGIVVDVYGLDQLPQPCESVSCLWLLHGRLQSKEVTAAIASTCISHWNQQRPDHFKSLGLLGVSFDQRNHGTRQINAQANQAWKKNENHALDMYRYSTILHCGLHFLPRLFVRC